MSRNPSAEWMLLIAKTAKEFAKAAHLSAKKARSARSRRLVFLDDEPRELANARSILMWRASRFAAALGPIWHYKPHPGLQNFPFAEWPTEVQNALSALYRTFSDACTYFEIHARRHASHPLATVRFRPHSDVGASRELAAVPPVAQVSSDSHGIGRRENGSKLYELRFPVRSDAEAGRYFAGAVPDELCHYFEDRCFVAELISRRRSHEALVWRELYPTLYPTSKFDPSLAKSDYPSLILGKPGAVPVVKGRPKRSLTLPQHDTVRALVEAGERGLNKDDLVNNSGHPDAINIVKRLAKSDPDWGSILHLPGRSGERYRVGI